MRQSPKYTDDDLDRLERDAEELIAEAERALDRAKDMFDDYGLDEDDTRLAEFFRSGGPSEELDELRREIFGCVDVEEQLMREEQRLHAEMKLNTGGASSGNKPKRRRKMTRV